MRTLHSIPKEQGYLTELEKLGVVYLKEQGYTVRKIGPRLEYQWRNYGWVVWEDFYEDRMYDPEYFYARTTRPRSFRPDMLES